MKASLHKNGFTLLYAVLVIGVLLSIVFAILNISYKQIVLSSTAKESQVSFYMADSGAECAQYWDNRGAFATSSDPQMITCSGQTFYVGGYNASTPDGHQSGTLAQCPNEQSGLNCALSTFTLTQDLPGKTYHPEAVVSLYKNIKTNATVLQSSGHNTNIINDPKRVERSIELTYLPKQNVCSIGGNYMILFDMSGSTHGYQTEMKTAAKQLIENLFNNPNFNSDQVKVGAIAFGDKTDMSDAMRLHDVTGKAALESDLNNAISDTGANNSATDNVGGRTNLQAAFRLAKYEFTGIQDMSSSPGEEGNYNEDYNINKELVYGDPDTGNNTVILISDGEPNAWVDSLGYYNNHQTATDACYGDLSDSGNFPAACQPQLNQAAYEADQLKLGAGASVYVLAVGSESNTLKCNVTRSGHNPGYSSCLDYIDKALAGGPDHTSHVPSENQSNLEASYYNQQTNVDPGYVYTVEDFDHNVSSVIDALTKCQ